jgi:phospholipase/lecithinase/hemolysin
MKPSKISHFVMIGDSLSDRGTFAQRYWCGLISLGSISGLSKCSPLGRFTNGLAWTDHLSAIIADQFIQEKEKEPDPELSEDHIDHDASDKSTEITNPSLPYDPKIAKLLKNSYFLDNDRAVRYRGHDFVRNYNEGGLTAHDYSWLPSYSFVRFFMRLVLSTLQTMRERLLNYDNNHLISDQHKAETLVVEWSGANDLITVNAKPSVEVVDSAIEARIQNAEELIKHGYHHFVFFNLPDLSLTPRYQAKSVEEQRNAHECSMYFNRGLTAAVRKLAETYPHASMAVFDVDELFTEVYEHPETLGFEKEKLKIAYTESSDFQINKDRTSPAPGYMFWDDVHPTAKLHELLAHRFYEHFKVEYNLSPPNFDVKDENCIEVSEHDLLASFRRTYRTRFLTEQLGFFGNFRRSNIKYETASIKQILKHALYEEGQRTREVIEQLQWIDKAGNLKLNIPSLVEPMEELIYELNVKSEDMMSSNAIWPA